VLSGNRCLTRGSARGGSLELSLALAPVAHYPRDLHLCTLRRTGNLTGVLTVVSEVGRGLAMRRQTQGTSARLWGPWGAPLASVLLPAVAVALPIPQ
jgi:hypothetical protein